MTQKLNKLCSYSEAPSETTKTLKLFCVETVVCKYIGSNVERVSKFCEWIDKLGYGLVSQEEI